VSKVLTCSSQIASGCRGPRGNIIRLPCHFLAGRFRGDHTCVHRDARAIRSERIIDPDRGTGGGEVRTSDSFSTHSRYNPGKDFTRALVVNLRDLCPEFSHHVLATLSDPTRDATLCLIGIATDHPRRFSSPIPIHTCGHCCVFFADVRGRLFTRFRPPKYSPDLCLVFPQVLGLLITLYHRYAIQNSILVHSTG